MSELGLLTIHHTTGHTCTKGEQGIERALWQLRMAHKELETKISFISLLIFDWCLISGTV